MSPRHLLPALLALTLSGCLEREETITVAADGSLTVVHSIHGDAADLDGGAAQYPSGEPWTTRRTTRKKADGKTEHVLEATGRFASADALPTRFGPANDPAAASRLTFRTSLATRAEGKQTRYRFVRTYAPRRWASYAYLWKRAFPAEVQALFKDAGNLQAMPRAKRRQLVEAVTRWERSKAQHWAAQGLARVAPKDPLRPEARLAVDAALAAYWKEHLGFEAVDALLRRPQAEIEARAKQVQQEVDRVTVEAATAALALRADQARALETALVALRQRFEVSEDLGDEAFVVRVALPGKVTRHNGDALEGNVVTWRFHGQDLRDRTHTLIATSVLDAK